MEQKVAEQKKSKKALFISILAVLLATVLALTLIIGTDSNWGKVEVTRLTLSTPDGDEIAAMMYKPKTASPQKQAPCVILFHGGNDMLEMTSKYAFELASRGYVIVNFDQQGGHWSDIATGKAEGTTAGGETVFRFVKTLNFVDQKKIVIWGHSMGGGYAWNTAQNHSGEVFLLVTLGSYGYGSGTPDKFNFNFVNINGDSDESVLNKTNNVLIDFLKNEQLRRVVYNELDKTKTPLDKLGQVEPGKTYSITGTDGNKYIRAVYVPHSIHAYYLINDETHKTIIYAITSTVGVGIDPGVSSYADINKISTPWALKDLGFYLELLAIIALMFIVVVKLVDTKLFASLKLAPIEPVGFKKYSWQWWLALVLLLVIPPALYYTGVTSANSFFGLPVAKIWLIGGTSNCYVTWQWVVAIAFLVCFLIFHFTWGKKHGGNAKNYALATSDNGKFSFIYILKALLFGIIVVGFGYLLMALITRYTQEGILIAGTMQVSLMKSNRDLTWIVYFIYLIPYFLCSSLAFKALGLKYDSSTKTIVRNVVITTVISIIGLLVFWAYFVTILSSQHHIIEIFRWNLTYAYGIAMVPLCIGICVGNALNTYVTSKTNSTWAGLTCAILWGVWTLCSCGGMTRYFF